MERLSTRQFDKANSQKHPWETIFIIGWKCIHFHLRFTISHYQHFYSKILQQQTQVTFRLCGSESSPGMALPPDSVCFSSVAMHRQTYIKQVKNNQQDKKHPHDYTRFRFKMFPRPRGYLASCQMTADAWSDHPLEKNDLWIHQLIILKIA